MKERQITLEDLKAVQQLTAGAGGHLDEGHMELESKPLPSSVESSSRRNTPSRDPLYPNLGSADLREDLDGLFSVGRGGEDLMDK